MRRLRTTILYALCAALLVVSGSAQQTSAKGTVAATSVPSLIRYGGTLRNAQGAAISPATPVGVTFSIYKQQDGGAAVWMETQNVTPDSNGQYNVVLGSTAAAGLPDDLFSQQEERWLGVQVQGQEEQARVLLVSVPYAFKAHEADTLGGLPASAFLKAAPASATNSNVSSGSGTTAAANGSAPGAAPPPFGTTDVHGKFGYLGVCCVDSNVKDEIYYGGIDVSGRINQYNPNGPSSNGQSLQRDRKDVIAMHDGGNLPVGWDACPYVGIDTAATGTDNTCVGNDTGNADTKGSGNALFGAYAGASNTLGSNNTLLGYQTGRYNTASSNTFVGTQAGEYNFGGSPNTCVGFQACLGNGRTDPQQSSSTNTQNTVVGYQAGFLNVSGNSDTYIGHRSGATENDSYNTFVGANTGVKTTAGANTFVGYSAGVVTTTGGGNTFSGYNAGRSNSTGFNNTYIGLNAGWNANDLPLTSGSGNVYLGVGAGSSSSITSANDNIFIGANAGESAGNTDSNIYIGNLGRAESSPAIRLGDPGVQKDQTYIAGINGATAGTVGPVQAVCVGGNGKLWGITPTATCVLSSSRFKEQVQDMDDSSNRLLKLRPVTFFYKPDYDDGSHTLQYGLIAEEVAKVDPDMVVYDQDGRPYTVKYQLLAPMLLNEFQKQHKVVTAQQEELQTQLQQIKTLKQQLEQQNASLQLRSASLEERLTKLESYVDTQMKTASDSSLEAGVSANGATQ